MVMNWSLSSRHDSPRNPRNLLVRVRLVNVDLFNQGEMMNKKKVVKELCDALEDSQQYLIRMGHDNEGDFIGKAAHRCSRRNNNLLTKVKVETEWLDGENERLCSALVLVQEQLFPLCKPTFIVRSLVNKLIKEHKHGGFISNKPGGTK